MKYTVNFLFSRFLLLWLLLCVATTLRADDGELLDRTISIKENEGTRYRLLRQVSELSGYLFIYDSRIINNDEIISIRKGEYSLRNVIYAITGNDQLILSVVGNHILLSLPEESNNVSGKPTESGGGENQHFKIGGTLRDCISGETIAFGSVRINDTSIGTITNRNGEFKLSVPDSLRHSFIKFSHVGYESLEFKAHASSVDHYAEYLLEPKVVPLQEVVVRAVNPIQTLRKTMEERERNYSSIPVYLTTFYREGIVYKKKNTDLTEAVLKIYKTDYRKPHTADRVKLIKMRRVYKKEENDTIFAKFKSGINSCLILDVMKNPPDFLSLEENESPFVYLHTDITDIDDRQVYVITFEQKKHIKEPLYKGQLFIDTENYALTEARFEVNPEYTEQATSMFIEKKSRDYKFMLRRASYTVSYKPGNDGVYYVNHVRGDLEFKVKKRKRLFNSTLDIWFEMVNCEINKENVKDFVRSQRLSTQNVFSETKYKYDAGFWGAFNVIVPEDKLKDLIMNNLSEIAEGEDTE